MNILVVGGGGREHALTWALARSPQQPTIWCAPGNAGTAAVAQPVALKADDVSGLTAWCSDHQPDLVVIGPEAPLCLGLADDLRRLGIPVFGPGKEGARLEGSKSFAKEIMLAAGVPTAEAHLFTDLDEAVTFLRQHDRPWVIKADGLAAGKGVTVCDRGDEAIRAVSEALGDNRFGEAGARVLIEERLDGEEASILGLVDGKTVRLLPASQDHKRAFEQDAGPNTGGMGAYSPTPVLPEQELPTIQALVFEPVLAELQKRGIDFCGVLYAGLMVTRDGPKVLEFNTRFGDPEAQCVLPRIESDVAALLLACATGELAGAELAISDRACATVVLASGGYPGQYETGTPISGLTEAAAPEDVVVFHAGTRLEQEQVVTAGGRVLSVTGLGSDLPGALRAAYGAVDRISFAGAHWRRDIGAKALARLPQSG